MRKLSTFLLCLLILNSCKEKEEKVISLEKSKTDYTQFVNPFIGTSKMGHVFPGATAPFGMVQKSANQFWSHVQWRW